jgi:hypothetical protein
MSIFNSVGIYVVLDVNSPSEGQHIDRSNPGSTYNKEYLEHVFTMINAFMDYPNTLAFFSGNEIMDAIDTGEKNPPYIRDEVLHCRTRQPYHPSWLLCRRCAPNSGGYLGLPFLRQLGLRQRGPLTL